MSAPYRVIVIDRHPLIRASLRMYFDDKRRVQVIDDFASAGDMLARHREDAHGSAHFGSSIDLVILHDTPDVIPTIIEDMGCNVLIYTAVPDVAMERHCLRNGAAAVVSKASSLAFLEATVHALADSRSV